MKKRTLILFFISFLIFPAITYAHRVSVFAYQEGGKIFVEGFFSDGTPTKHANVEVFDKGGKKLFSGRTNEKGTLSFKAPGTDTLKIVLNASMGHRAEILFHLNKEKPGKTPSAGQASAKPPKSPVATRVSSMDENRLRVIVHQEVARAIQPVMRTLAKQEAKRIPFSDIIGGIGWIIGLMGIWMILKARGKQ